MKTKITLMTVIATVALAGAAFTAKAQYGYRYAPARHYYAPAYGYGHPMAAFHDRRDIYRDEVAIHRDRYDLYRDRAYGDRFGARMERGNLDRSYREMGHDRRDFRRARW